MRDCAGFCSKKGCLKPIPSFQGIFCANYSLRREPYPACRSCWCAECFTPLGITEFPIRKTLDETGIVIEKEDDKDRFMVGRDGDHLMNPFQCELCHFRNIQGRNPHPNSGADRALQEHFRRVSLNVFWSREPSTVRHNLGLVKRLAISEVKFDCINRLIPALGPHPLKDASGMGVCVLVLDKSMDRGRYEPNVQWETFRKMCST